MAKPKSPSAALWRINLSQCPWRSWSWLDNTHCMQKYAAVAEKNKKYCSLRTKFESSNKNNPTDWNWFKEKQKQISLFASFLLESKTVSKKCPELQIQQRGGWPSWHQFLLGRLFANWPRIIILVKRILIVIMAILRSIMMIQKCILFGCLGVSRPAINSLSDFVSQQMMACDDNDDDERIGSRTFAVFSFFLCFVCYGGGGRCSLLQKILMKTTDRINYRMH